MSTQLFVVKNETDGAIAFYAELEKAKSALKSIYDTTIDFKYWDYEIQVYDLVDGEYVVTSVSYMYEYRLDRFSIIPKRA